MSGDEQCDDPDDVARVKLVELLVAAEEHRHQGSQVRGDQQTTIHIPESLSPEERAELNRLMECANRLDALAAGQRRQGSAVSESRHPETIGPYRIQKLIADGGFGAVYLARDDDQDRRVAIKIPRPDVLLTDGLRDRFLIESRAAATLNHPNIVAVYDAITADTPAIVYEYCDGGTLSQLVARRAIRDEKTAIRIVLKLAEALHHAHTRGILHRDLKPGNVLLVLATTAELGHSVEIGGVHWIPKLGDFGLAKVLDDTGDRTQTGIIMGTPEFMAPEQAAGRVSEFGTHTDIFSLGAILYWLLTGVTPFRRPTALQTLRMIESESPESPRRRRVDLSVKTEAVCLKCLRKPIDARYASAAALAEDLRHLLRGEPVSARSPSLWEQLTFWRQRHPALAVAITMFVMAASLGMWLQWANTRSLQAVVTRLDDANQKLADTTVQALQARQIAEQEQARYANLLYTSDLQLAQRSHVAGDVTTATQALSRHIPRKTSDVDRRGPEWRLLWEVGHPPGRVIDTFPSAGYCVNLSPDGRWLVACGADATIRVYATATWKRVQLIETGQQEVNYADFSADGTRIASAGDDGTAVVWDWQTGQELLRFMAHDALAYCVKFCANDTRLATCGREPQVKLWDAQTGKSVAVLSGRGDPHRVEQLAVSADGQWLASASFDGRRRVWQVETRELVTEREAIDSQRTSSVCLFERNDANWMLSGTLREESRARCQLILEELGETRQRVLPIHFDGIQAVTADSVSQLAAAGDHGGRISLIDINAAVLGELWWRPDTLRRSWVGHDSTVYALAMLNEGQELVSLGHDGQLMQWYPDRRAGQITFDCRRQKDVTLPWLHMATSSEPGAVLAVLIDAESQVSLWDVRENTLSNVMTADTHERLRLDCYRDRIRDAFVLHKGRLYGRIPSGRLACWQLAGSDATLQWTRALNEDLPSLFALDLSDDGRLLAACCRGRPVVVHVLDAATGTIVREIVPPESATDGCRSVAFNPRGNELAIGTGNDVHVCHLETGQMRTFSGHTDEIRQLCFVPGANVLISGSEDRTICLWDLTKNEQRTRLQGHRAGIQSLNVHPFGDRLISSDDAGWIHLWTVDEGLLLLELPPSSSNTWHATVGDELMGVVDGHTLFWQQIP